MLAKTPRIGIVGGAGWLGNAIAEAVLGAGVVSKGLLSLSFRSKEPKTQSDIFWTSDNRELAERSDVVVLAVRPQDWRAIDLDLKGKLVVSVMAGITLQSLSTHHSSSRVVRAMPNAAVSVAMSYTPWVSSEAVTDDDKSIIRQIFAACGPEDEVYKEEQIDYLTALTGSGPALAALLASAMMRDAVSNGLEPHIARRAASALIVGSGRLLESGENCPSAIVDTFREYRGTTAAAISTMLDAGFDNAVSLGLKAAFKEAQRMGERL